MDVLLVTRFIWYRNGIEIDAFSTYGAADAAVRRANKYGYGENISIDPDGNFWDGFKRLPDSIFEEQRSWDGV